ncbi:MAG TPA: nuclear transport factor 2 family protein [Longimicrobiales bacterium]|nr:nuclear transport factor 2 family protein [Longimicrobiales bacterium]
MLRSTAMALLLLTVLTTACTLERKPEAGRAPDPEQAAVMATIQRYVDALEAGDADALASTVLPEGSIHAVNVNASGEPEAPRSGTAEGYVEALRNATVPVLGRIWNTEVRVHEGIAMVWAPYDFWRGGEFSHCGVDLFTLVKTAEGWRIATITYTARREGCEPSPLGPPAAN